MFRLLIVNSDCVEIERLIFLEIKNDEFYVVIEKIIREENI